MHVAPLLCAYLRRYPAVVGELVLSDRMANLVEDGIDAAVRIGVLRDSSLVARSVGSTRRVLVAPPKYLQRRRPPRTPDELAGHDAIQGTSISPASEWRFGKDDAGHAIAFSPRFATNSVDAAIGHAERGGGVVSALAYQVVESVRAGRLRVLLPDFERPPLPIHVVYPTTRLLSAKVRAFVERVTACDWRFVEL